MRVTPWSSGKGPMWGLTSYYRLLDTLTNGDRGPYHRGRALPISFALN